MDSAIVGQPSNGSAGKALACAALALLVSLTACSTGSGSSTTTATAPAGGSLDNGGASSLYVAQGVNGSVGWTILQLSATANGSVSPLSTLTLPSYVTVVTSMATDSSGQMYVAEGTYSNVGPQTYEVLVYAAGASGAATPVRTITLGPFPSADAMAIDSSGALYVTNGATIMVFPANANGAATPSRTITGALTQLSVPANIAVDKSGNIFVGQAVGGGYTLSTPPNFNVLVFSSTANGNIAPTRVISLPNGPAYTNSFVNGSDMDTAGNLYLVGNNATSQNNTVVNNYFVMEVAAGATGTTTPIKTITGSTGMFRVHVDAVGNLYTIGLADTAHGTPPPSVGGYSPSASGSVSPTTTITSSAWSSDTDFAFAIK